MARLLLMLKQLELQIKDAFAFITRIFFPNDPRRCQPKSLPPSCQCLIYFSC